jgi:hypothetical protein
MSLTGEISQLLKKRIVIRHRTPPEQAGRQETCLICRNDLVLPPGTLCLAVADEGYICNNCGNLYAPDMMNALGKEQPAVLPRQRSTALRTASQLRSASAEWIDIAKDIEELTEKTNDLARGISRGIVEAPAGHIGLMHYAKDFQKPPRKASESEKDFELRVRTLRMTYLLEKIQADTIGRIGRIASFLRKLGMPDISR